MDNKYYTPSLEDIHVGYECEWTTCFKEMWLKTYLESMPDYWDAGCRKYKLPEMLEYKYIRTPFLSKEQIEAEGWKESDVPDFFDRVENDRWYISWEPKFKWISIGDNESQNGFSGTCPSINEFRKISKWLNIQ